MSEATLQDAKDAYQRFIDDRQVSLAKSGDFQLGESIGVSFGTVSADEAVAYFLEHHPEFNPFRQDLIDMGDGFEFRPSWRNLPAPE